MKGRSRLLASADGGRSRLAGIRSCAPLSLRETPDGVYLVGGAAGPLGGDDLLLELEVRPGATVTVRSSAASLALPGDGSGSTMVVEARVAAGGTLHWLPEPVIAGAGCRHRIVNRLTLETGALVTWREELVLGRVGEDPGSVSNRMDVTLDGRPILRNDIRVGPWAPGWDGPAVAGPARAVGSLLLVGSRYGSTPKVTHLLGRHAGILPLAGDACVATAAAEGSIQLRELLDRVAELCRGS